MMRDMRRAVQYIAFHAIANDSPPSPAHVNFVIAGYGIATGAIDWA